MSKDEKVVDLKTDGATGTEDIKATDFVEPEGKMRKVIKWIAGGLAFVATGVIGGFIGHRLGSGKDDDEADTSSTEEPANE